ncbi:MAG: hypothetical protein JWR60_2680 [Polaromonas sp.]|nr:hypothetical protein [Polaromonas sp.]
MIFLSACKFITTWIIRFFEMPLHSQMLDFTEMDSWLLELIGSGIGGRIQLAEKLAIHSTEPALVGNKAAGRGLVDRRLLALRRSGKIIYLRSGWTVAHADSARLA